MSWQDYVDSHILCSIRKDHNGEDVKLTSGAIVGLDGSVWAQSSNFPAASHTELQNIIAGFVDAGTLAQSGMFVGGAKYMVVQGDPGAVIRGKKGPGGLTAKKTTSCVLIGIYEEPVQPGECNIIVENLGDYLISQGM